jgi:hypothetical protein
MTNLPAIRDVEDRALSVARQWFAHWRDRRDTDPLLDLPMTRATSSAWIRHATRIAAMGSIDARLTVIAAARRGHPDAAAVVQEMIHTLHSKCEALPAELAVYAMDRDAGLLHFPRKHGPGRHDRMVRDWHVMLAVAMLVDHFGLAVTRNTRSRGRPLSRRSACSLVAEGFGAMGEKAVEKIWNRWQGGAPTVPGWSEPFFDPSGRLLLGQ